MKKIIISNQEFDYDFGCKLLKLKYENSPFPELEDIWEDIVPPTFKEIAELRNLECRRVAINCLGIERLVKQVKPILVDKETISKKTYYVDPKGNFITKKFKDTYELYKVSEKNLNGSSVDGWNRFGDAYYVKCKDTSTDREYMIWVDINSVQRVNNSKSYDKLKPVNAIQCIAWTITTNIDEGHIDKIVRQGDCILIKPIEKYKTSNERHLTEKEYRELLVAES